MFNMQSGVFSSVSGLLKTATGGNARAEKKTRATRTSPADVVSIHALTRAPMPHLIAALSFRSPGVDARIRKQVPIRLKQANLLAP